MASQFDLDEWHKPLHHAVIAEPIFNPMPEIA